MRTILGIVVAAALSVPGFAGTADVRDVPVYNDQNQKLKLGEISEVLVTPEGKVTAAIVLEVEGGQQDRSVAVPVEQMKSGERQDHHHDVTRSAHGTSLLL